MDKRTDKQKISPLYRTLSPIWAAALLPPMKTKEKEKQDKGTADHLMPLGYFFYANTNPSQPNRYSANLSHDASPNHFTPSNHPPANPCHGATPNPATHNVLYSYPANLRNSSSSITLPRSIEKYADKDKLLKIGLLMYTTLGELLPTYR